MSRRVIHAIGAALLIVGAGQAALAQSPPNSESHVTIPFLANAAKPADLEFEAAEPAGKNILAEFCAETLPDPRP